MLVLFNGSIDIDRKFRILWHLSPTLLLTTRSATVLTTSGIYWSMLETSFGLTAACLPVLYTFLRTGRVKGVVNHVRSKISLRSSAQRSTPGHTAERSLRASYIHITSSSRPEENRNVDESLPSIELEPMGDDNESSRVERLQQVNANSRI